MILLDWTRMGHAYCLAGIIHQQGQYRVVRPRLASERQAPIANIGWTGAMLHGFCRWGICEMIDPEQGSSEPPHLEDIWVKQLQQPRCLASPEERRVILQATMVGPGDLLFGEPLIRTRVTAHLKPRTGVRSLTSLQVEAHQVSFGVSQREGRPELEHRVRLQASQLAGLQLPITDHTLLTRAEQAGPDPQARMTALTEAVRAMGASVVVRLGLTRPFAPAGQPPRPLREAEGKAGDHVEGLCWLMADGFFSWHDPQP
jgi:hypothetical protein